MIDKKLVVLSLICVVLCAAVVEAVLAVNQKDNELQMNADQISGLENEKTSLEAQVAGLQSEITALSSEKASLEGQVSSLQTDIATLQTEIASLENEVIESFNSGYAEGETDGYQRGYDDGYELGIEDGVGDGWYISRDPTLAEAVTFINLDTTDENEYTDDYVCYDFTADFNSNAFQMGYRCGFVYIEFDESAHAIACFNTTDAGLIYVEPQTDEVVDIAVGQEYIHHVIVRIGIIW